MPKKLNFNHPVRLVREALSPEFKISQEALASLIGCSKTSIQQIESGKLKLSESMANRIDEMLGSNLIKWVALKMEIDDFKLDASRLLRNFKIIRGQRKQGDLPSVDELDKVSLVIDPVALSSLSKPQAGIDQMSLFKAADEAIAQLPQLLKQTLQSRGCSEEAAVFISENLNRIVEIRDFCGYEKSVFKDIASAAVKKGKFLPFLWEFEEWLEEQNQKLGLGLDRPSSYLIPDDATGLLLNAVEAMSDEELGKLGIQRITKTDVLPGEIDEPGLPAVWTASGANLHEKYDEVRWYDGLDAN